MGAPLFRRAALRMTPTALGEEICRRAVEVERSFVQAEASLRRGVRAGRRTVRVTVGRTHVRLTALLYPGVWLSPDLAQPAEASAAQEYRLFLDSQRDANALLRHFGSLAILARTSVEQLLPFISRAKALRLVSSLRMGAGALREKHQSLTIHSLYAIADLCSESSPSLASSPIAR